MESGSFLPVGDITEGQALYDTIVEETGCTGSADTLQCLRALPFDVLKAAIDKSPGIFDFQVSSIMMHRIFFCLVCRHSVIKFGLASQSRWSIFDWPPPETGTTRYNRQCSLRIWWAISPQIWLSTEQILWGDCDDEGTLFSLSTLNITHVFPFLIFWWLNWDSNE